MNTLLDRRRLHGQRGMTTLGLIILVTFVGLFVYAGIRLVPVYLEDFKIAGTMKKIETEFNGAAATRTDIQKSIGKRFDVEGISVITVKDVKIKKTGAGYDVSVSYSGRAPFVANIFFVVEFSHQVDIIR